MRLAIIIVVVWMAAAALGGCGEGGATSAGTSTRAAPPATRSTPAPSVAAPPRGPGALARSALLHQSDLASYHWQRQPKGNADLRCSTRPFRFASAMALSGRYRVSETVIQDRVGIYRSAAASARAFALLNAPASRECLRRNAQQRMTERSEGRASRPTIVRTEVLGRWGRALRFSSLAPSQVGQIRGLIDIVHVRVGRGVGALAIVSGPVEIDEAVYERIVAAFRRRLDAVLG